MKKIYFGVFSCKMSQKILIFARFLVEDVQFTFKIASLLVYL